MALQKLQAFTAFLLAQNLVGNNRLDSWTENAKLVPAAKNKGQGYLICRLEYDAVISLERFAGDEALLMVLVCAWLHDHDDSRDDDGLPAPDIDIDILDNQCTDIELSIRFREDIDLIPDEDGPVTFNGQRWVVSTVPVDGVNTVGVGDNPNLPTDKPYQREDSA